MTENLRGIMTAFIETVLNGMVSGVIYALMSLGFVVVFKTTRVANFALGEFIMTGAALTALAYHLLAFHWMAAILFACLGMLVLSAVFNRVVLLRMRRGGPIAVLMVTIGLGAFLQGLGGLLLRGFPRTVPLPLPTETVSLSGMLFSLDEWSAGGIAIVCIALLSLLFMKTRAGLALRVLAEDRHVAEAMGISGLRYSILAWGLAGSAMVIGGILWTVLTGGGFSMTFLGLKVFPIVIIGGLESLPGAVLGGILIGVMDALAASYLDPYLGGGFGGVSSFLVLILVLMIRPYGLFGYPTVERV